MKIADSWDDYKILDCGEGKKLELWGTTILDRPDPQAIWPKMRPELWNSAAAVYVRSEKGGGAWEYNTSIPDNWEIGYGDMHLNIRLMGFKHTGVFPEQAVNWDWMREIIKKRESTSVLNLFAYTGGATLACALEGAEVAHVDAAKGMVNAAKENLRISGREDAVVRYLVDDVFKFVNREIRRENKYDAVIMDPPSYGRGAGGQIWKLEDCLFDLVQLCTMLLSDNPAFFLINSYTTGLAPSVLANMLRLGGLDRFDGNIDSFELALPVVDTDIVLPCGASGRWEAR